MKRAALLVAACGDDGADNPLSAPQAAVVEWREGQTVVVLGTSLTFGSGCKIFPFDGNCALPDSSCTFSRISGGARS